MSASLVLIFESTSHWTAELERSWEGQQAMEIRWRPHRDDLIAEVPLATLAVLVVSPNQEAIELIHTVRTVAPHCQIVCLTTAESRDWESFARELGGTAILPDVTSKEIVRETLERILASPRP